jgi:anti-sigma B factor antagonist
MRSHFLAKPDPWLHFSEKSKPESCDILTPEIYPTHLISRLKRKLSMSENSQNKVVTLSEDPEITRTTYKRCEVIWMKGRIDTYTAPKLQQALDVVIDEGMFNIVFNMEMVDFLSSKGLWVLTETQKKCKKLNRGKLVLVNTNDKIRSSFDLVGMGGYFEIYEDLSHAIGDF